MQNSSHKGRHMPYLAYPPQGFHDGKGVVNIRGGSLVLAPLMLVLIGGKFDSLENKSNTFFVKCHRFSLSPSLIISEAMTPSNMLITLSAKLAMRGSWVTKITVLVWSWFNWRTSRMTSKPVSESRSPVISSPIIIGGSFARAR